jgi:cysteinyl-tRNA synthetase
LDDDLNTPQALAVLHDVLHQGNTGYAEGSDPALREALGSIRAMLDVLGLDPLDPARPASPGDATAGQLRGVVDALVGLALEQREAARGRKDFATADSLRDRLKQAGIAIEDTPRGPRWTIDGR